ncbi:MAG: hypothetical protein HKN04_06960, partial [Rhodothermaceae bacterium]|nr:hypothetical protein [Rhodothermaceae bacterium]
MSDAPTPPASVPPPTDPTPRPRRVDWRPKLRWFGAEYLIVVLGVLTAVGLNAWWQGRQDAAREQAYLHQLVDDLQETRTQLEHTERILALQGASLGRLLRPYRSSSRPPGDSVLTWMGSFVFLQQPAFVTGTATALVETGDLNLIRNDSLRTAITSYLGRIDRQATNNV